MLTLAYFLTPNLAMFISKGDYFIVIEYAKSAKHWHNGQPSLPPILFSLS